MYRRSSESRMRSGTCRGVSKWSRRKGRYIGRLYSDIGKVPSGSGIFRSTGELREYGGRSIWPLLGFRGEGEEGRAHPPLTSPNWTRGRGGAPSFLLFPLPFPCLLLLLLGRGNPTPGGSRTPRGRAIEAGPLPPSTPLYTGAGGTPETQQLIIDLLAVCGAPLHHI